MKRVLSLVIVLMLAITMFSGITASAAAIEATLTPNFIDKHAVYRYFGATRIETALEVAKEHWYDPYDSQCNDERNSPPNALILAYAKNFPDALVGGTISAAVDAPIILTNNAGGLEANVRDYIKRCVFDKCHGTRAIYILGGTDVISAAIEQDVKNLLMHAYGIPVTFDQLISGSSRTTSWNVNNITDGYYLKRLAGDDRYGTATAVATELNKINVFNLGVPNAQAIQTILANFKLPEVFLTNGNDFPDALAITPVAGSMKVDLGHGVKVPYVAPILFTQGANATVNATTAAYLADRKVKEVVLIGGYTVLNSGIETDLSKKGISNTSRVYGETRYETSLRIYEKYRTGYTVFSGSNDVVLATARDFPDALVGGALACKLGNYCKGGVPILMIDGTGEVKNDIKNTIHSTLSLAGPATAYVMGGSVAVSSSVLNAYFPNQQLDVPVLDTHASIEIVTDDNVYPVFGGYTGNIVFSGDRASLAAVVRPRQTLDKSVTWTSDRPDVASIDVNGVVTVKDVKTLSNVLITATTVAKDAWGNSRSETMTLTVLPNVPATGISFVNFGGKGGSADDPVEVVRGNEYWLDDYVLVSPASVTLNNSKYTASTLANNIAYLKHGWLVIDSSATNLGKVTTVTVRLGNFSDTLYIKVVDGPGTVEPGDGGSQGHGGSNGSGWGYGSHHGGGGGGRGR